jgi:hypothetical protein
MKFPFKMQRDGMVIGDLRLYHAQTLAAILYAITLLHDRGRNDARHASNRLNDFFTMAS